ncbi:UDP-N-acetylmuramoyl-tripeptide--D-alanyl-D-alanine ligase [Massilia sp. RP-1-19]|uniref:UDP-N-acetylmuramoyl-tripeptide--D-alanyl-D-alanine ligase n=1 Tax=Massilia polaris TaxID=2728846 RepID=A0A848HMV1_9BURK|nr:UDP-N-acetylmuramoyl-tripeptide--D-alanyl-D-alanine ligase [Massilia polaris]NML62572.1 UDP-N-acetylmuramoyl-tripeptide--D-alanyl-D-alanine ligase [Massilia polaris]
MRGSLALMVPSIAGARMTQNATFESVTTDSRTASAGELFVALRGENFDGHDFLEQVAGRGVGAVVVEELPPGLKLPAIVVPNTLVALGQIANFWRARFDIPVIGVTGSNGKTTVKEMIAAILAQAHGEDGRLATRGNLNNEIGVPLTLMRLTEAHQAAVVELGMNHPGEIGRLTAIAAPTIGLVNNAQREHQEFMHTVEAVAQENGAVIAGLPANGVAVFPADDTYTDLWLSLAQARGQRKVITFGLNNAANVSCAHRTSGAGSELDVTVAGTGKEDGTFSVQLAAFGMHNVRNALASIACAVAAGIGRDAIVRGLEAFAPVSGRLQRKQAVCGATVIDDTYNANPDSVRAAIDVLAEAAAPRILVLGDMGEVGTQGREFHEEIAAYAASRGIATVLATGELARHMTTAGAQHFEQFDELLAALGAKLGTKSDATVLVKGSRFMEMERVVQHLLGQHNTGKEAH